MRRPSVLIAALSAMLAGGMMTSARGGLEFLGQPARAKNILTGEVVVDRRTGSDMLVLSNNNEAFNGELIFLNPDTGVGSVVRAPAGAGAEAIMEIPGDRLALGAFYDGSLMIFDLKRMQFIKTIRFPGEKYIWGFAIGNDGRLYCGTYPGGKLGALDLNTYALEDLGNPAPPNAYLRSLIALLDGRILCRFLGEKPTWVIYDPAARTFSPIPEELRSKPKLAVWNGYLVAGNRFLDRDFHVVTPPPVPPMIPPSSRHRAAVEGGSLALGAWEVDPLTTADTLYMREGRALWRYRKNSAAVEFVTSIDLRGGHLLSELSDGRIAGVRGQDYFIIKPRDTTMELHPIPGESAPRVLFFLRADPQGRIWGGPPYALTLFEVDPKTRTVVNTPTISDNGGEVYDIAFVDGVTYAAAYSGGEVIRYDPNEPWDEWKQINPKTIAEVSTQGFYRPTGGIILGPGEKLYSGWTAIFGTYGGCIAITDPKRGTTEILKNPLGEQQVMGIATDGELLYVGTGLDASGLPMKPGASAVFGIIDPTSKKVVWQQEVSGAERIRVIGYDALSRIVVSIIDGRIRLFDTLSRTLAETSPAVPSVASWVSALPGDGFLYYGSGKQVLALDLRSGALRVVANVPQYVNNVTMAPNGDIYIGAWTNLYALHRETP